MQDSFFRYSPRGSVRPFVAPLFNAACLPGSSSVAAAASLTKRRFSKSPSVLTITGSLPIPDTNTRRGSKIPLGDYFSLVSLLPPLTLLSRSFFPTWHFRQRELEGILRAWNTFPRRVETSTLTPVDFIPTISSSFDDLYLCP